MAQPPQQQSQGDDQEFLKLAIIAIICVVIVIAVLATQQYRVNAALGAVTWVHILPFALAGKYLPLLTEIPFFGRWLFWYSGQALEFLERGGFAVMDPAARNAVLIAGGRSATVIYGGILIVIAVKGTEFRVDQKYRSLHTLESMIYAQSEDWVTSRIARHVNPLKVTEVDARRIAVSVAERLSKTPPVDSGTLPRAAVRITPSTWSRALRPEEWLLAQGLTFDPSLHGRLTAPEASARIRDFEFSDRWRDLSLDSISEALSTQLRTPWRGPQHLSPSLRAIFAIMALFYDYDIDGGNRLMNELGLISDGTRARSRSMDGAILAERGMMAKIDRIALGKQGTMLAQKAAFHAYVESAFPTMLAVARKDRGVLPAAGFLWLKAEDRLMWYILNNVGNEAVMVEAAGALAHARAESQLSTPIRRPAVYQAARAILEDYLDMTEERIESRRLKEIRRRTPGQQLAILRDDIVSTKINDINEKDAKQ